MDFPFFFVEKASFFFFGLWSGLDLLPLQILFVKPSNAVLDGWLRSDGLYSSEDLPKT